MKDLKQGTPRRPRQHHGRSNGFTGQTPSELDPPGIVTAENSCCLSDSSIHVLEECHEAKIHMQLLMAME